jgi:hypothetical protein
MEAEGVDCEILYPAATLRRFAGLPADNSNRDDFQRLSLPGGATAILRPQLMRDDKIGSTLTGTFTGRPGSWREHINQHVFFWVSGDRADRFRAACVRLRAHGAIDQGQAPVVVEIDTASLLAAHHHVAFFSLINSGSTLRGGSWARRDDTTLRPILAWRGEPVVELAIRAPVPLASRPGPRTHHANTSIDSRFASTIRQSSSASTK